MPEVIFRVKKLSKNYGKFTAVKDLSFELKRGEIFGFLGPNGAGKTTTIKVCVGLLKPTKGQILIDGFDIVKHPVEAKTLLGYVPDNPYLYDKLTGREFVRFVAHIYDAYGFGYSSRRKLEERIRELFDSFEMNDKADEIIQSYSRGMRQKTAIISALIHNPQLLFVDEPTSNLDPKSARLTKDIFRHLSQQGATVFMSTHVMEIAERLCDRIGIVHKGELIALGTLDELHKQVAAAEGSTLEDVFLELTSGIDVDVQKILKGLGAEEEEN